MKATPSPSKLLLLLLLVGVVARGRVTVATVLAGTNVDNARVHSGTDAVVVLEVHLGESVLVIDRSLNHVGESGRLDDRTHHIAHNGLILGDEAPGCAAHHALDVTTALLGASSVAALLR